MLHVFLPLKLVAHLCCRYITAALLSTSMDHDLEEGEVIDSDSEQQENKVSRRGIGSFASFMMGHYNLLSYPMYCFRISV